MNTVLKSEDESEKKYNGNLKLHIHEGYYEVYYALLDIVVPDYVNESRIPDNYRKVLDICKKGCWNYGGGNTIEFESFNSSYGEYTSDISYLTDYIFSRLPGYEYELDDYIVVEEVPNFSCISKFVDDKNNTESIDLYVLYDNNSFHFNCGTFEEDSQESKKVHSMILELCEKFINLSKKAQKQTLINIVNRFCNGNEELLKKIESCDESKTEPEEVFENPDFEAKGKTLVDYKGNSETVIIPDFFTEIGDTAFYNCTFLKSVTIPNTIIKIGERAFDHCTSLGEITIPAAVTEIGRNAFRDCESLKVATIQGPITKISAWTFIRCKSLTAVTLPNTLTEIGYCAFTGCESLETVLIPDSVSVIESRAFEYCTSLTTVNIPDAVKILPNDVFSCSSASIIRNGKKNSCGF